MTLLGIGQLGISNVTYHVVRQTFQGQQGIIFIGVQILLAVLIYVILVLESE